MHALKYVNPTEAEEKRLMWFPGLWLRRMPSYFVCT